MATPLPKAIPLDKRGNKITLPRECAQHGVEHTVYECASMILMALEPDLFKTVEVPVEDLPARWNNRVDILVEPESTLYLNQNEDKSLKQVFVSLSSRELQVLREVLQRNYAKLVTDFEEFAPADFVLRDHYKPALIRLHQGKAIYNRIVSLWKAQEEEEDM